MRHWYLGYTLNLRNLEETAADRDLGFLTLCLCEKLRYKSPDANKIRHYWLSR